MSAICTALCQCARFAVWWGYHPFPSFECRKLLACNIFIYVMKSSLLDSAASIADNQVRIIKWWIWFWHFQTGIEFKWPKESHRMPKLTLADALKLGIETQKKVSFKKRMNITLQFWKWNRIILRPIIIWAYWPLVLASLSRRLACLKRHQS